MIRVLVDSSADYPLAELKSKNIEVVPLIVNVGNHVYQDEVELERNRLYEYLLEEKNVITTSQPSPQAFQDIFEDVKEKGDEMICVLLSSALSGTFQSARLAKDMVDYDKIYLIDSLTATIAIRILVEKAIKMINEKYSAEEIVKTLEELKGRVKITAAIDTLKYLYLGGRVSKTTAFVADVVNVKPAVVVTKEGEVGVVGKYLGIGRAIKDLTKQMKNAEIDPDYPLYLIYSYGQENCDKLRKSLQAAGIADQGMFQLGATLGVHIGPGAFGIVYVEKA
ncbi:MAG: DegV family protein [Muricoprocola sp.]